MGVDTLIAKEVFVTPEAIELGLSATTLNRLVKAGKLQRLDQGIYRHVDADQTETLPYSIACLRVGDNSLIGGLTALFHYRLIDDAPKETWVVVSSSHHHGSFPRYRVVRTKQDPTIEVECHGTWRIATIERAIVEAIRFASKIGLSTALSAARTALVNGLTTEERLYEAAESLKVWPFVSKHWEALTLR
ncbi:MAG: hypothetical protein EOP04_15385 [Proteobacteria bacterium]|nr:MAG: hypothetical protein EOP04_15385 [Pseudomonadota bacterium]